MSVLLGHTALPPSSSPVASPDLAVTPGATAGPSATASSEPPSFGQHRFEENQALRKQFQTLKLLLDTKEVQASEMYALLQARIQESEHLWLRASILQEELGRCQGRSLDSALAAASPPAVLQSPLASPIAMPLVSPTAVPSPEVAPGFEGQMVAEPGTPNSRHVLSLLSVTPGPTMGTYVADQMPLLPPMEPAVVPSPSGRTVPSPPRHPAPAAGLLSPEKATSGPPERDATEGVAVEVAEA